MRIWLISLVTIGAATSACAQYNLVQGYPTGGTCVAQGYGSYTTSGSTRSGGGGMNVSCSGPLTWQWAWSGALPVPSYVVISVQAAASWAGQPNSGSCSDGLDDPALPNTGTYTSQSSSGTKTYVVAGAQTVPYSNSPAASDPSTAQVSTTATVAPMYLKLTGPVATSGTYNVAVGQLVKAEVVSPLSTSLDEFYWVKPGSNPFANYQVSSSAGVFTDFSLPSLTSSSMSIYFGAPGNASISCVYYCWVLDQYFTLTTPISVAGPTKTTKVESCGKMQLLVMDSTHNQFISVYTSGGPNPTDFRLWGAIDTFGSKWGCFEYDTLSDPTFLLKGSGSWTYAQLKGGYVTVNGQRTPLSGIDGSFPYPHCAIYSADGLEMGQFADRPGVGWPPLLQQNLPFAVDHDQELQLFAFYKPASDAAGSSVYIPMTLFPWKATGTCSTPDNVTWSQLDRVSGFSGTSAYPWPFPQW